MAHRQYRLHSSDLATRRALAHCARDTEGRVPAVHISRFEGAVFARGVYVRQDALAFRRLAHLCSPYLGKGEEKFPLTAEALGRARACCPAWCAKRRTQRSAQHYPQCSRPASARRSRPRQGRDGKRRIVQLAPCLIVRSAQSQPSSTNCAAAPRHQRPRPDRRM